MSQELFGRDAQLARVGAAIAAGRPTIVVLVGEPGIGKSALWEHAIQGAHQRGYTLLQARATQSEAPPSYSGLTDLMEHVPEDIVNGLPAPQRQAVWAATLRDRTGPVDPHVLGAGLLGALRATAERAPVLLAVDDDDWLDAASAGAVRFALRRLRTERVAVLLTRRASADAGSDGIGAIIEGPGPEAVRVHLGPLDATTIARLLTARTDLPGLAPGMTHRVYEASGGNPFYALAIAEALRRGGGPYGHDGELPVPGTLHALLRTRLATVAPEARRAVLVTAMMARPRLDLVRAVLARDRAEDGGANDPTGPDAPPASGLAAAGVAAAGLAAATGEGLLVIDGDRVRPAHPLIGAVARAEAPAALRRRLHRLLAGSVPDAEERVRHLALGTILPDAAIADELARVADTAADRGSARAAAELTAQAWRLTPIDDDRHASRLVLAATRFSWAGLHRAGVDLIAPELPGLPAGPLRARARFLFAMMSNAGLESDAFAGALAEADPPLRAEILADMADRSVATGVVPVERARDWAAEAVAISAGLGNPAVHAGTVTELAWLETMLGTDPEPLLAPLDPAVLAELPLHDQSDRVRALRAMWRGEVARARDTLVGLLAAARARQEEWSAVIFSLHLFEVAIRVGDWTEAARLGDEVIVAAAPFASAAPVADRVRAWVAAGTGNRDVANQSLALLDALATAQIAEVPESRPFHWHRIETRRAVGLAALLAGDTQTAADMLTGVAATIAASGFGDPGVFPIGADLIEALARSGRHDAARDELTRFSETAIAQDHPWALAGADRARGILLASLRERDAADAALTSALARYRALALPFDEARTMLALGAVKRDPGEARALTAGAAERFKALGSPVPQ